MSTQPETTGTGSGRVFERKVVDVCRVFHDALARHIVDGRIDDKEKLEQGKLKISASLVNFVVNGGVLLFTAADEETALDLDQLDNGRELSETGLYRLLRETIFRMLNELNKPDVNLLRVSLAGNFRQCLQMIFTGQSGGDPTKFPVKVLQDFHEGKGYYIAINMRNTRSVGDDIDRIERDTELKREIIEGSRHCRHSDGNLMKLFSQDLTGPGSSTG